MITNKETTAIYQELSQEVKDQINPLLFEAAIKANKLLAKYAGTGKMTTDEWCDVQQSLAGALRLADQDLAFLQSKVTIDFS